MKHVRTILAVAGLGLALGLAAQLHTPARSLAFTTIGHELGNAQRDFRVYNVFADPQANNNTTAHPNFPGVLGADLAIWKAHVEWGSGPWAGDGLGDGLISNEVLGDGGANFDTHYQGAASGTGGISSNVHSPIAGTSGGTLAFMQGGTNGWWIRYYEGWTWQDGPDGVTGGIDLQGVATHEAGHALGLGHSGNTSATMTPAISGTGTGQRSIHADDIAGLQSIYGAKAADKPEITALSGSTSTGGTLTIHGAHFAATGNEVWFTNANAIGVAAKVTGVAATDGGTRLDVTIPADAVTGTVMVDDGGGAHVGLSNAWPIDIAGVVGDLPNITGIDPANGPAGGWTAVTITGTGFGGTTSVTFDGLDALAFSVDDPTRITAVSPPSTAFASGPVEVTDDEGSAQSPMPFFWLFDELPQIDALSPASGDVAGGTTVEVGGPTVVGVHTVTFGGVPGSDLVVTSATTLRVDTPPGAVGPVDVKASNSTGADTLVDGFTYTSGGPGGAFVDLGPSGTGGTLGEPTLTGAGDLTPGGAGYTLTIANAPAFATGTLFITLGDGSATAAFKGGVFFPVPVLVQVSFGLGAGGDVTLPLTVAGSVVGPLSLVWQWWNLDPGALLGVAGSNGLRTDIP